MKIQTRLSSSGKTRSIIFRISFRTYEETVPNETYPSGRKYRQLDYSTGLSVNVKDWDKKRHLTRNNSYLNGQIADGLARVNEIGSKLAKEGKLTFDNLRTVLNDDETLNGIFGKDRKTRKSNYLPPFEFIENFIQRSVATEGTKKDYRNTLTHMENFDKFRGKSLSWKSADYQYYLELVDYLKEKRLKASTIDKIIKNLKVFLSQADLMDGIEVCQDFKKTVSGKSLFAKVSKEEVDHVYLTESEIRQITNANMPDERLAEIRDLFVIQCWTGLRVSDLSRLELDNIKDGLLSITAKKTRQKVVIPVVDELQAVLNKYPDQLPKIPTDQHFNREIKKVCELAGINDNVMAEVKKGSLTVTAPVPKYKLITSHTARRSFATNLYRRGIPSTQLMLLTGHKSENSFLKYIKVSKEDNAKDVAKKLKRIG